MLNFYRTLKSGLVTPSTHLNQFWPSLGLPEKNLKYYMLVDFRQFWGGESKNQNFSAGNYKILSTSNT